MQKAIDGKSSIVYSHEQLSMDGTQTKATLTMMEEQLASLMDKVSLAATTVTYDATNAALARETDKHMGTINDFLRKIWA